MLYTEILFNGSDSSDDADDTVHECSLERTLVPFATSNPLTSSVDVKNTGLQLEEAIVKEGTNEKAAML